jgi:hypothetical protein
MVSWARRQMATSAATDQAGANKLSHRRDHDNHDRLVDRSRSIDGGNPA